jgi:hypothetical protein
MRWTDAVGIAVTVVGMLRPPLRWTDAVGIAVTVLGMLRRRATRARDLRLHGQQTRSGARKPADRCVVDICWYQKYIGDYCLGHASQPVRLWSE